MQQPPTISRKSPHRISQVEQRTRFVTLSERKEVPGREEMVYQEVVLCLHAIDQPIPEASVPAETMQLAQNQRAPSRHHRLALASAESGLVALPTTNCAAWARLLANCRRGEAQGGCCVFRRECVEDVEKGGQEGLKVVFFMLDF
jgi:hypothetical protein